MDFPFIGDAITKCGHLHQFEEMTKTLGFLSDKNLNGFIEVGSANGASFYCWASLIQQGPKISVDWNFGFGLANQDGSVETGTEEDCPAVKHRNTVWRENFSDVCCIDGDSRAQATIDRVAAALNGRKVGWIFIDAWHEYDAMWQDFNNYKQFLAVPGYIGFHDIFQSDSTKKFWAEIKQQYPNVIEFSDGTGTGIIEVR